jgi:hypothetical protein
MFTDLHEGILEEFASYSVYYEGEFAAQIATLEKVQEANDARKEERRARRACQRHVVRKECPRCHVTFCYTEPRVDGRPPDFCSRRCGALRRKGKFLAKGKPGQIPLFG